MVVPIGNREPDAGEQLTMSLRRSVVVAGGYPTITEDSPGAVSVAMSPGQVTPKSKTGVDTRAMPFILTVTVITTVSGKDVALVERAP
jgi:hypothetical protein